MKKFLKGVVGYFLGTAMFVYTACIFMEPNLLPVFDFISDFPKAKTKTGQTEGPAQNRTHRSGSFQSEPGTGY